MRFDKWAKGYGTALLVIVLAGLAAAELAFTDWSIPLIRAIPALFACGALFWRKRQPLPAVLLAFGAVAAFEIPAGLNGHSVDAPIGQAIAGIILIYSLCRWAPRVHVAVGLVVISVLVFLGELTAGNDTFIDNTVFIPPWLIVGFAALAMRYRASLLEAQHQQVRLNERHALARDLHDSVAHYISAIAVQAQAAVFVAETDPAAAQDAVRTIEETANTALDEMRQMVGILRSDSDLERSVTPPDLDALAQRHDQPAVHVVGTTDLTELPNAVAAAIYRIAQEAITNASRHSAGVTFVEVSVSVEDDGVKLQIINDGQPTTRNRGSGYGMIGMTERVDALGGTIEAGPRPASGWQVHVYIPTRSPA